jgi:predicted nucleotidyltransferase
MIDSLFPKTKQKILSFLFLHPDEKYYLMELVRGIRASQGTIHRELKPLVADGILRSERKNKQVFYSVNKAGPLYEELRRIVYKSFGVSEIIKKALKPSNSKIIAAFIYGSVARFEDNSNSDIDLMIIGDIDFKSIAKQIIQAETLLARTINPTIYPLKEFQQKLKAKNHFLVSVLKTPLIFIVGDLDVLRKLAK